MSPSSHPDLVKRTTAAAAEPITFAYSGDPDDAFAFYGLASGRVPVPGGRPQRHLQATIQELNERAIAGEYEVTAISSAAYPRMRDRYWVSGTGSSVGRGYGPLLATKSLDAGDDLRGRRVGSPGPLTTGNLLLRMFYPECEPVYLPFEAIRGAILKGEVEAGVLIHEELLNYRAAGLRKLRCLGAAWQERTELPLPVGLNVVRRDLGRDYARSLVRSMRASLEFSLEHRDAALRHAYGSSIAMEDGIAEEFIGKFANGDTLEMDGPTRRALDLLLEAACEIQGLPSAGSVEIL